MTQLKSIRKDAVPAALQKAERYRLINDPWSAESICLDVLAVDPDNQQALIALLLAYTDEMVEQLTEGLRSARDVLPRLTDDYKRAYYAGLICERRAKAHLRRDRPGGGMLAHTWLREAMEWYERAEAIRPPDNDESILRWNACVRLLERRAQAGPDQAEVYEPSLE